MAVSVNLPDDVAQRLVAEAARRGLAPEQLAAEVLDAELRGEEGTRAEVDPFAWIGTVSSDELRGRRVEELLAKGFGQSRS
jgi:plasmid stability protein